METLKLEDFIGFFINFPNDSKDKVPKYVQ